jgi:pyruvate/2-oxoacid:ferredoxin oxidoreductase alpha subunit
MEFCGLVGYYRRFVRGFADLEKSLQALTFKDAPWVWTTEHQEAFDGIKKALSSAPVLAHPDFSLMDSFIISTDASKVGIGAVLSQVGLDGVERPIFICSRTISPAESRYAPTALECLAVV